MVAQGLRVAGTAQRNETTPNLKNGAAAAPLESVRSTIHRVLATSTRE
jgi:hypothetical protein